MFSKIFKFSLLPFLFLKRITHTIPVSLRILFDLTDKKHWFNLNNFSPYWESRYVCIGKLIPANSKVLEFGCGRMNLVKYLPSGCVYIPSDIISRGSSTFVCNLNARNLPNLPVADVVVFSGVLEYVNNVPRLIANLKKKCPSIQCIVASYAVTENKSVFDTLRRRGIGWVNSYSEEDIIKYFGNNDFNLIQKTYWNEQVVFKFTNQISKFRYY
jgi:hypothetical protein